MNSYSYSRNAFKSILVAIAGMSGQASLVAAQAPEPPEYITFGSLPPNINFLTGTHVERPTGNNNHAPYHKRSYLKIIDHANKSDTNKIDIETILNKPLPQLIDGKLGDRDFYTKLVMEQYIEKNAFQVHYCTNKDYEDDFWLFAAELGINYINKSEKEVPYVPVTPIVLLGKGVNEAGTAKRPGCSAPSMSLKVEGPYMLYQNFAFGQGEYKLNFKVTSATFKEATKLVLLNDFAAAAIGFAFPAFALPAGLAPMLAKGAGAVDQISKDRSDFWVSSRSATVTTLGAVEEPTGDKAKSYLPPAKPYLAIQFPWAEWKAKGNYNFGFIEVYQSRSASLILDQFLVNENTKITASNVLESRSLVEPHTCMPGSCQVQKDVNLFSDFIGPAYATVLEQLEVDRKHWATIFSTCKKIQEKASEVGLSTIDALLVRWAFLENSGLLDMLIGYQKDPSSAPYALIKLPGHPKPDQLCWKPEEKGRAGDAARMQAIHRAFGAQFCRSDDSACITAASN